MKPAFMQTVTIETALLALAFLGAQAQKELPDLITLQIEDLMNVNVTSASKKEEKNSKVAAAVFVISEEDIHRSAATNIPDLLRLVPGLEVAQINPSTWAIGARGFNGEYSTKLLVLIDGRTMYTPLFPECTGIARPGSRGDSECA
jgi:iron complex outermembrane receptor protein